ncbi:family 16 glycosylhydrolase [Aureimonas populi]|uniref:Beta-glucanase n=1 Tax=Aureimonas populi TaxID=1701758 RepID=A0ABW5CR47_9HYPH|nr:family 16 glycosylhydrolase [Aureimonas populi]
MTTPRRACAGTAAIAAALASLVLHPGAAASEEMDGDSFLEEFDRLDRSRWYISDGWTNGDHQNCGWSAEEVSVENGRLLLGFSEGEAAGRPFRCGEIQTTARFGYGTYEARIRTPAGSGLNANIFTYIGQVHGRPHDEIDFEFLLKDTSVVQLNVYADGQGGNEYLAELPAASDDGFLDYAFVWEADAITWYIEGEEVYRIDDPAKLPQNNAKIYLSLWGTDTLTDWMGPFTAPQGPVAMEVERVAFTRIGEDCQFEGSVACTAGTGR